MENLVSGDLQIAPLRKLDDFLLESARFQVPNVKDIERWANRVNGNLLYYQTNYFIVSILIFLVIGLFSPGKLLIGMLSMATAIAVFLFFTKNKPALKHFKQNHPLASVLGIFGGGYLIVYMFNCVLIFLLATLLPVVLMFIHSSLRLRNLKNKLSDKIESVGLRKTPMGMFLGFLGQEMSDIHFN